VKSNKAAVLYRRPPLNGSFSVEPVPADLRMSTGNAGAGALTGNTLLGSEIYWGCGDASITAKLTAPPASCPSGVLTLHVGFPSCWDGLIGAQDDSADLAYPVSGTCPAGYPHVLPRVVVRIGYAVGTATAAITLSSGSYYSAHAHFWNTWQQDQLAHLVTRCLNALLNCGTDPQL
jgi:Domain of unknown function (DUF1996)